MPIAYSLQDVSCQPDIQTILTIGTFDGVHLGHQVILNHVVHLAKKQHAKSVVITFSNHPTDVLRSKQPIPSLCSMPHKLKLLEEIGVDVIIALPFTKEFSEQSPEEFLCAVQQTIPLQTLILGSDAHIGKDRTGDRETLTALSKKMHFYLEYLPDSTIGGSRISSSRIRDSLQRGDFQEVATLLGRPYTLYAPVLKGNGRGAPMGFPTLNLSMEDLCHPPLGVYTVNLRHKGKTYDGVANLGFAPTLHQARSLLLEVHLLDVTIDLYGSLVEVEFHEFLRPEQHFESVSALRAQIAHDIDDAKKLRKAARSS
ncbi:MAG: bifunctional riboflavin kinase/FAD synthetase [Parachlamydiaceae bacterium]